ncbi:MAG: acyltransferase, partial [Lentimicrobium sp.]|nr:acyltransferase [Lentimicrobium sp.]
AETDPLYITGRFGFLGVDVFFVISGFVIPYAMYRANYNIKNIGRFLGKRFVRIEPPYILSIFLVLFLNWLSTQSPYYRGEAFNIDSTRLLLHFGYLNAFFSHPWYNDVYWTLAIEFQYYIIIALFFPLLISKNKNLSIGFLLIFGISGFFLSQHSLIFNYSLLFIVGILLFQFRIGYLTKGEFGTLLLIALMLIFAKFDKRYLVAALLPYFFINYFEFTGRISKFLGNISYSLYLVHIPIGGRIINLTENFVQNPMIREIMVFVALAISILAAWLFYMIIEKPAINWSKRVSYNKKVAANDQLIT